MQIFKPRSILKIDGMECEVLGYIEYRDDKENFGYRWYDYRLKTPKGEMWLSVDDTYEEYVLSWPITLKNGQVGPKWHKVDEGTQVVSSAVGDVDVDRGERADYAEFEDATEEYTLSLEMWSDGTEASQGEYYDENEIEFLGVKKMTTGEFLMKYSCLIAFLAFFIIYGLTSVFQNWDLTHTKIKDYVSKNQYYVYETSITGSGKQKADVYLYLGTADEELIAKDIVNGIYGHTEAVSQNEGDGSVTILTSNEYCIIYVPEEGDVTGDGYPDAYVQVSSRKYAYSSESSPYHSSGTTSSWYRTSYYSSGYSSDARRYTSTPSAYKSYDGVVTHDLGNGYLDAYSSSVRQSSRAARSSDGGGLSGGK